MYIKIRRDLLAMTFSTWLKTEECFSSKAQYDYWLKSLPCQAKRQVILYYKEKYQHFLDTQPKQLEFK